MINILLNIVLIINLIVCFRQDVKYRSVHFVVYLNILIVSLYLNYRMDWGWLELLDSLVYLTIIIIGVFIYTSLLNRKFVNIFKKYFGIGDLIFLVSVIPLFSFGNFKIFFISGVVMSVIIYLVFNRFQKQKSTPLAGYLSLYLSILLAYSFIDPSFLKMDIV